MQKTERAASRVIVALAWLAALVGVVLQMVVFVLASRGGDPTRVLLSCLGLQAVAAALIATG